MVIIVTIIIWGAFGFLAFRSREEPGDVLRRVSTCLYKKSSTSRFLKGYIQSRDRQVLQNLLCLHPGQAPAQLLTEYYTGKIRIVLLVLLTGSMLACLTEFGGENSDVPVSQGIVSRGEEMRTITLEAKVTGGSKTIREKILLDVRERELREEEAEELYQEFIRVLEGVILGENVSAEEIRKNLCLPYEVEGYPFAVNWTSTDTSLLGYDGIVHLDTLESATEVWLRAEIVYGEQEWKHSWRLTLLPPLRTEKEQLIYDLKKYSDEAAQEYRYEESFPLPQMVGEREVIWRQVRESSGANILFIALAAAVAVYCMKDRDLQEELVKRRACMKQEYPVMVSKYALLLGAGMTVRGAFQKICKDYWEKWMDETATEMSDTGWRLLPGECGLKKSYRKKIFRLKSSKKGSYVKNARKKTSHEKRPGLHPLYEEMLYSCNELQAGVSESRVYENFGRRTGVQEYTRLCTLLNQNLKKGNATLVYRLKEEYDEALREGMRLRKRQGEEAGTKLLTSMVMMLLMVLLMIMLPAFSGLGI